LFQFVLIKLRVIRPHRSIRMRPIVTDRVACSVGLSVGLSRSWALQKVLNRLRCHFGCGFV